VRPTDHPPAFFIFRVLNYLNLISLKSLICEVIAVSTGSLSMLDAP
jgi:hypothetical protein